jgi:SAM-dependent methyltransferase
VSAAVGGDDERDDDRAVRSRSFGQVATAYHRFRPRTPEELVPWLLPPDAAIVIDLAAGTGALSEVLAPHVGRVVAVEPDPGMRAVLRGVAANVSPIGGTAEAIPVTSGAVDAVLVSSAWHWFDAERASAEIGRVVRHGGRLAIVGNSFDPDVEWVMALRRPISGDQGRPSAARPKLPASALFTDLETTTLRWRWPMSRADLVGLLGTYSRVIVASPEDRAALGEHVDQVLGEEPTTRGRDLIPVPMRSSATRATVR